MLQLRKIIGGGRKSDDRKQESEEEDSAASLPPGNWSRKAGRRHSSVRSNSSDNSSKSSLAGLSPRRSLIFMRSPFKGRNGVSRCRNCKNPTCTCPSDSHTGSLKTGEVVDHSDENGNMAAEDTEENGDDPGTIKINGTSVGHHRITPLPAFVDDIRSTDQTRRFSNIEKKIRNLKQNAPPSTATSEVDKRDGGLSTDVVLRRKVVQSVPDADTVQDRVGSPRLYAQRSSAAATLPSRCYGLSSGHPELPEVFHNHVPGPSNSRPMFSNASTSPGLSGRSVALLNPTDSTVDTENLHNLPNGYSTGLSSMSAGGDNQHSDAMADKSDTLGDNISTSTSEGTSTFSPFGIFRQNAGGFLATPSSGHVTITTAGESTAINTPTHTDTPVPPPRRNRLQGRRISTFGGGRHSYIDGGGGGHGLSRGVSYYCLNEELQQNPAGSMTKSRSLSELYNLEAAADVTKSSNEVKSELSQSRSSTITSGIVSDLSPPLSVTSSSSSSSSSAGTSNSERRFSNIEQKIRNLKENTASVVNYSRDGDLRTNAAAVSHGTAAQSVPDADGRVDRVGSSSVENSLPTSEAAAVASDCAQLEKPGSSLINSTLQSSSSSSSTSTVTTASSSYVTDSVKLKSPLADLILAPSSVPISSDLAGEPVSGCCTVDETLASLGLSSSFDHAAKSSCSHSGDTGISLLAVSADPGGNGTSTHLRIRQLSHPVSSLRALRYSSNCVNDLPRSGAGSGHTSPSPSSPLALMMGRGLDDMMTPKRVAMTTETPASGQPSPSDDSIGEATAEITQLVEDQPATDDDSQTVEREVFSERFVSFESLMGCSHDPANV